MEIYYDLIARLGDYILFIYIASHAAGWVWGYVRANLQKKDDDKRSK